MGTAHISFVPLLIVTALAFAVPLLLAPLRRVGIPVVVGEILAGMVFGNSGLNLVTPDFVLQVLSVFGFAYLMFLSGLELDFSEGLNARRDRQGRVSLTRLVRDPVATGVAVFLMAALCSVAAGFLLKRLGLVTNLWLMALILSTTSLGVVAPVLKERGLTGQRFGQAVLMSALLADFITILLISAYVLWRSRGVTMELLLVLVLFAVFAAAYRAAAAFREHMPARRLMHALSTATSQIQVRGAFAVAMVFIALAESLGIENILGAFLAGVIISLLSGSEGTLLRQKLDAIGYGFFIPIFFIMVGVKFNLAALMSSSKAALLVPLLVSIAYGIKFAAALVMRTGYSWRQTFAAGALLSSRLSLIIAAASIGLQLGAISEAVNAAIILVAIVTCTVSPVVFNLILPREAADGERIIVVGARREAEQLTRRLRQSGVQVSRVEYVSAPAKEGNGGLSPKQLSDTLREAGIDQARAVVAMADSVADNLYVARIARSLHGIRRIVAWVQNPADNDKFQEAGAQVVNPDHSTLLILENLVISPGVLSMGTNTGEGDELRTVKLQNQGLIGRRLISVSLPEGAAITRIERGGATLIPESDTLLRANDTLTLVGPGEAVDVAARLFSRRW